MGLASKGLGQALLTVFLTGTILDIEPSRCILYCHDQQTVLDREDPPGLENAPDRVAFRSAPYWEDIPGKNDPRRGDSEL